MAKTTAELKAENRQLSNEYVMANLILNAIDEILDGNKPSEFELSFPIVQKAWDTVRDKGVKPAKWCPECRNKPCNHSTTGCIQRAQRNAGELAVMENLKNLGLAD